MIKCYVWKFVLDVGNIEGKIFYLLVSEVLVKFIFELIFFDMKWVFIFSGELVNLVFYFFLFGNVNNDNKFIVNVSLG